jgi:hypothetical protein
MIREIFNDRLFGFLFEWEREFGGDQLVIYVECDPGDGDDAGFVRIQQARGMFRKCADTRHNMDEDQSILWGKAFLDDMEYDESLRERVQRKAIEVYDVERRTRRAG